MDDILLPPEHSSNAVRLLLEAARLSENEEQLKIKAEGILEKIV